LDNLSAGHEWAVRWGPLVRADVGDQAAVLRALVDYRVDAVIHLAAFAYVGESMARPAEYFQNNFNCSHGLLEAMRAAGLSRIIFSSSCATYGNPQVLPITECHPQNPTSPYGESKRMVERMLEWYESAYGLAWLSLRYFNAAGADPEAEIGEAHDPETHIIPSAINAAHGKGPVLQVFGTQFDSPDGTAVRDFVHVTDLATAHVRAIEVLIQGCAPQALNLGTGTGCSVKEAIAVVERATRRRVPVDYRPPRPGDPAILVADARRSASLLDWTPKYSSIEVIVETANRWHGRSSEPAPAFLPRASDSPAAQPS
jgi:UDP-arabinose 4-epimerase